MKSAKRKIFFVLFMAIILVTGLFAARGHKREGIPLKTVLTNLNIIDCTGKKPKKDMTIIITGNTITDIYQGSYKKTGDEKNVKIFDLQGGYVLPGFWNVHMHLAALLPDPNHI